MGGWFCVVIDKDERYLRLVCSMDSVVCGWWRERLIYVGAWVNLDGWREG